MSKLEALDYGAPYAIGTCLLQALRDAFADTPDVTVKDNPKRLQDLKDGDRLVFYEDSVDRFKAQSGNTQQRVYAFNVGVINRTPMARLGSHQDYRRAKQAVRHALQALRGAVVVASTLREGDVMFRVENIDVGGGLVMGSFTVEYRDPD